MTNQITIQETNVKLTVIDALKYVRFEAIYLPQDPIWQELICLELKDDYPFCNFWITQNEKVRCILQQIPK